MGHRYVGEVEDRPWQEPGVERQMMALLMQSQIPVQLFSSGRPKSLTGVISPGDIVLLYRMTDVGTRYS